MPLAAGTRRGAYELIAPLGTGGMGEVYRARDSRLGREVALKVIPADMAANPERLARFEREARVVASLNHPNIVMLHSIEESGPTRFLTMELVEGQSLDRHLAPGGLPVPRVLDLGIALAEALVAAHDKGVVHRDLKPANVMLTREGRVKVLDFGLAKLQAPEPSLEGTQAATMAPLSSAGTVVGTVPYMSPEQLKGEAVDARTDLFSLGVVLYELATGHRPFTGATSAETISSILRDTPRPLIEARQDAPRHLARIIDHCLMKDPEARFQTAKDVRNELRALLKELDSGEVETSGIRSGSSSTVVTPVRGASRRGRWIAIGAVALVAVVTALWFTNRRPGGSKSAPPKGAIETSSIAVLPFANMTSDKEQEYFSDGLTEELLNVLAKIPELKVAGRTSSFAFKGKNEDLRTIARTLGVANILEGSVRKSGDRIRITAQLVKADDGFHLWSETYDRKLDDVFAVQDDIARSVAASLKLTLLGGGGASPNPNGEAYDLILKARFVIQSRTPKTVARAKQLIERALQLSPDYAPAWAGLGLVLLTEANLPQAIELKKRLTESALRAFTRALELDPNYAVAHSRMANVYWNKWDFAAAERSTSRALAAEPKNPIVMGNAALLYANTGRLNEAIELGLRVLESDPLRVTALVNLTSYMVCARRLDEADVLLRRARELSPDDPSLDALQGDIHLYRGEVDSARTSYARFVERQGLGDYGLSLTAIVEHTAGNETASRAAAAAFEKQFAANDPSTAAEVRAWRGEMDAAFAWLDKAYAARDPVLCNLKTDPYMSSLYTDPRWNMLLKKVGLPTD